jgi:hypothetical protein
MAQRPVKRIITKNEGGEDWTELAAFWIQASGSITGTFSKDVVAGTRVVLVDVNTDRPAPQQRRASGETPGQK